jgi:hypothetical protein
MSSVCVTFSRPKNGATIGIINTVESRYKTMNIFNVLNLNCIIHLRDINKLMR